MFCPKCGQQNPENGKFCRGCGTDLSNVSDALTGKSGNRSHGFGMIEPIRPLELKKDDARRTDPTEVYGDGIRSIMSGIGFLAVSMALLFTGVANGRTWWWAMLFPAFTFFAKGISDYFKSKKMAASRGGIAPSGSPSIEQPPQLNVLPQAQPQWAPTDSRYKTGDLVPPSVTDGTTRHLEIDSEGQTMTLPKK